MTKQQAPARKLPPPPANERILVELPKTPRTVALIKLLAYITKHYVIPAQRAA